LEFEEECIGRQGSKETAALDDDDDDNNNNNNKEIKRAQNC
jgi:hypothetical protein